MQEFVTKEHICEIDEDSGKCLFCQFQWLVDNDSEDGEFCPRCDIAHYGPCLEKNKHDFRVRPRKNV